MYLPPIKFVSFGSSKPSPVYISNDFSNVVDSLISATELSHDYIKTYPSVKKSQLLQKHSIEKLNPDKKSEIVFLSDDKKYSLYVPDKKTLRVDVINKRVNSDKSTYVIKDRQIACINPSNQVSNKIDYCKSKSDIVDVENKLKDIFDELDFRLLKLRRDFASYEASKKETNINVDKPLNWRDRGVLSSNVMKHVEEINQELDSIAETSKLYSNSTTCANVRRSYSKKIQTNNGTRKLVISDLGDSNYEAAVNAVKFNNKQYWTFKISHNDGKFKNFVICENGQMQLKPDVAYVSDYYFIAKDNNYYLSQKEVDNSDVFQYLLDIKKELKSYNQFLRKYANELMVKKDLRVTNEIGSTKKYDKDIKALKENFFRFRKDVVRTFRVPAEKHLFRSRYNIVVSKGHHSIIFKNITSEGNNLYLDFPKIHDKEAIKIVEFNGNDVFNTFVLQDNKLIKFNAKDMKSTRFKTNCGLNYYSQEFIDNSDLCKLLSLMNDSLGRANREIQEIWQNKDVKTLPDDTV